MQLRRSLAALSLCLLSAPAALAEDDDHSTVSVFLPFYSENWWKDMHGSIISEVSCAHTGLVPRYSRGELVRLGRSDWE